MSLTRSRAFHLLGIQLSTSGEVSFRGYITSSVKEQGCSVVDNQFDVLVCGRETVQSAVYYIVCEAPKEAQAGCHNCIIVSFNVRQLPNHRLHSCLDSWSRSFS